MFVVRGRVFHRARVEDLCLGIEDGRIAAIRKVLGGDDVADYGDALILPGGIDLHVHLREPGLTDKEDLPSGTRSAALGGTTTVLDMPNTDPPVTTRDALDAKIARIRGRAHVDVGVYAAPRSGGAVSRLDRATAFKVYMAETTGGLAIDDDALADVLEAAGETGKVVAVHAEDPRTFGTRVATDLRGHDAARPKEAEVGALKKLAGMGASARLHVAHVTCVEALDAAPSGATTEATPHHLFLDRERPLRAFGKVNPPLRSPEDRDALWTAFVDGRIDVVASDHAPHTRDEKEDGPFAEAPSGVPGVGTSLPLLLRRVKAGDLSLERLVAATASRPAAILGLDKGDIRLGADADLVVVDPRRYTKVTAKRLRYKCDWTPFEGLDGCFPHAVYVRGEAVVEDGEPAAEGVGSLITAAKR
ncbi:MAG: dihydroorotase [Methanobacteriota archaeon]